MNQPSTNISSILSESIRIDAILNKSFPTVVLWNRLETRPRTHHFDKALKAEVRDALWMLTKQWQMGEFNGDDAASPVSAKVHITSTYLTNYQAAKNAVQPIEENIPLEVKVEQKKIPFVRDGKNMSLDIRLQMGRYWIKLLKAESLVFANDYIEKYFFELPVESRETESVFAHREVWQQYAAISGRAMDGFKLYQHLKAGKDVSEGIVDVDPGKSSVNLLAKKFVDWYEKMYDQPVEEEDNAWLPDRLEYQFNCSAESDKDVKKIKAEEYYQGHLDWYAFDLEQKGFSGGEKKKTFTDTFIPSHIEFDGMPDTRWWKFEDGKTSFGDIKPNTTDLSKLLLMEFGLVFANDWFIIPYTLPIGSLANVEGLTVTNNFGETIWIKATEEEKSVDLPWSMFKMKASEQNNSLFLAPTALKVHEGQPLEEVVLIRDEQSNMVWGIESIVPSPLGKGEKGSEIALQTRSFHEKIVQGDSVLSPVPYAANVSYLTMTNVPENWIPFIPVHKKGGQRKIQLQRSSMLRIIEGDKEEPVKIKPSTSMLREGLDNLDGMGNPKPLPYFLHEEEVPRAGVRVFQAFQRTRWTNGEVYVWLGMKKNTGRGEGSSGLAFDQIKDVE